MAFGDDMIKQIAQIITLYMYSYR